MSLHQPDDDRGTASERFEYFLIRLTRSDSAPERVAGLVERIGSGEKRSFENGDQLLRMIGGWFAFNLNLHPSTGHRNSSAGGPTNSPMGDGA